MRLPDDAVRRALALGLTAALAGCGVLGGGDRPATGSHGALVGNPAAPGPAGDYPVVIGEPFTVDGVEYAPSDALNYDEVGLAGIDAEGGAGVTAAHRTLPLPSYVEVTSLESGRTILVRVERRGPMTGSRLIALSPAAREQLGAGDGAAVRVRRVNPPEADRAELRAGRAAPLRMDTPATLLGVLRRKLPASGSAALANSAAGPAAPSTIERTAIAAGAKPPVAAAKAPGYALAPLADAGTPAPEPARPNITAKGEFVVQAATFSSKANAERAAESLDGFVTPSGSYFRVRTGPYASRGQAEAALAKVRAAGYSDAKVSTAG